MELGIEAPTLEAARKRIENTCATKRAGKLPDGARARNLLVAKVSCDDSGPRFARHEGEQVVVVSDVSWRCDNAATRRMVNDGRYVVLDTSPLSRQEQEPLRGGCAIAMEALLEYSFTRMAAQDFLAVPAGFSGYFSRVLQGNSSKLEITGKNARNAVLSMMFLFEMLLQAKHPPEFYRKLEETLRGVAKSLATRHGLTYPQA